jgi:hypothetical protein
MEIMTQKEIGIQTDRGNMRTRAERRHHHHRMVEKVKKFDWLKPKYWSHPDYDRDKHIKKLAENRQSCSCHACGNPRKHHKDKLTMQEKRFNEYDIE